MRRSHRLGALIALASVSCGFPRPQDVTDLTDANCSALDHCREVPDAAVPDAGVPDASAICDPRGTFDAPVAISNLHPTNVPRLTADELEIYFSQDPQETQDIYMARRSSILQPFGNATPVNAVNTTNEESDASVSSDGLILFFESDRIPAEGYHIYISTRTSRASDFGTPLLAAGANSATATDSDIFPFVTSDGQELWFSSTRAGGLGLSDIYRATRSEFNFTNVVAVRELNTSSADVLPVVSADKLTVYLSSRRQPGVGGADIWTAHRSTTSDGFPAPTLVPELNSIADDLVGWLSPDNCRLYFSSNVSGRLTIYIANRRPL